MIGILVSLVIIYSYIYSIHIYIFIHFHSYVLIVLYLCCILAILQDAVVHQVAVLSGDSLPSASTEKASELSRDAEWDTFDRLAGWGYRKWMKMVEHVYLPSQDQRIRHIFLRHNELLHQRISKVISRSIVVPRQPCRNLWNMLRHRFCLEIGVVYRKAQTWKKQRIRSSATIGEVVCNQFCCTYNTLW